MGIANTQCKQNRQLTDQCDNSTLGGELSGMEQVPDEPVDTAVVRITTKVILRHRVFLYGNTPHQSVISRSAVILAINFIIVITIRAFIVVTCSTVVLQCYRRQAIPMEQAKIRPSVTLYSLERSLPNLVWLIVSKTATHMPISVKFG